MDRMKKRTLCLLLAACMLLGLLAGCGKKNNAQQLSATVYVPQYLDLNLDLEYVRGGCCDGENLYVIGQIGHDATGTPTPGKPTPAAPIRMTSSASPWRTAHRRS